MVRIIVNINSIEDLKKLEAYDILFIDSEGNAIASEDIKSHKKFNDDFVKSNPEILERYKKSNWDNMTLFLICEEGYMQVGKIGNYKGLIYDSLKITKKQEEIKNLYEQEKYDIENLKSDINEKRGEEHGR